jgi:dTDP-4-dehydrorhamnose 3,5-epimerase-like enzyme
MSHLIDLETYTDSRGNLTVIEKILPFDIKRVFYIYSVDDSIRGKHRHKKTIQAVVCVAGECKVSSTDGIIECVYHLNSPTKGLVIMPEDWHAMFEFSKDAVLLVLASEYYDKDDYVFMYKN